MTLREVLEEVKEKETVDESILSPEFYANMSAAGFTGVIALQALTAASLAGLIALLVKLNDKTKEAVVRRKAKKALDALDIKEADKEAIDDITKKNFYSVSKRKQMIEEILKKYRN